MPTGSLITNICFRSCTTRRNFCNKIDGGSAFGQKLKELLERHHTGKPVQTSGIPAFDQREASRRAGGAARILQPRRSGPCGRGPLHQAAPGHRIYGKALSGKYHAGGNGEGGFFKCLAVPPSFSGDHARPVSRNTSSVSATRPQRSCWPTAI